MSVLSTSSQGGISVNGLISGINTDQVITGLLAIQQAKLNQIDRNTQKVTTQQSVFKALEAKLLGLQSQMTSLSSVQNSIFEARTAKSSNTDLVTAAASSRAVAGVYALQINKLAKAHQVASQGFDQTTSEISQGTVTLQTATGTAVTLTIDPSNNTLQGLATAINNAGVGITASIVNDGGGDNQQSYRLLLSSQETGTSQRIQITNNLAASSGAAVKPVFDGNSLGTAQKSSGFTGTSALTSGGAFTGTSNNAYTFTIVQGGTVGTDDGIQVSYTDQSGANTGTLTINAADVGSLQNVAQGIQVQFGAGTLVTGQTFSVKGFVPTVQEASDASITLGSGSGAFTITNSGNRIDNVIPGVTLNLLQADATKTVSITVANDVDSIKKSIQSFVTSYNDVIQFISDQTKYDADSKTASPLLGNAFALSIQDQLRSVMTNVVTGANSKMNQLRALGISTDNKGQLVIDDAKMSNVLNGNVSGVNLSDVKRLFALSGTSSNAGIQFVVGSTKTKPSATPYQVNITQAAEQASLQAASTVAALTTLDSNNNTLAITVGTKSTTLTLTAGSYSREALVQEIQGKINADANLAGQKVTVGLNGDKFTITTSNYGSSAHLEVTGGTGLADFGFAGTEVAQGRDVVGNLVVNGNVEAAVGNGQFLVANSDNANTSGLQIRVNLSAAQVGTGIQSDLEVSRGFAAQMDTVLNNIFDPVSGRLKTIYDGFQTSLDNLTEQKTRATTFMESKRQSLLKQFAAMEDSLAKLQSATNFLGVQLSSASSSSS